MTALNTSGQKLMHDILGLGYGQTQPLLRHGIGGIANPQNSFPFG